MIYFIQAESGGSIKIGYTNNLHRRRIGLETHYGERLVVLATMEGGREQESQIHRRFASQRIGRTEQFRISDELVEFMGKEAASKIHLGSNKPMQPQFRTFVIRLTVEQRRRLEEIAKDEGYTLPAYLRFLARRDLKQRSA